MPDAQLTIEKSELDHSLLDAARSALQHWPGKFSEVWLLKVRENAVFAALRDDGSRTVLRIHRQAYHSDAAIRSELAWMSALSQAGISAPEAVATRHGGQIAHVAHPSFEGTRQCDMLSWVHGETIGTVGDTLPGPEHTAPHFEALGALAASLHNHAEQWQRPAEFERPSWDREGLVGIDPHWGRFWELSSLTAGQRNLLTDARDKAFEELTLFVSTPANYGLIHADLIPDNVMVSGDGLAVIDFDDCGQGWHMFDIATILFVHLDDPQYHTAYDALIRGYRTVRPLSDDTLSRLELFLFLRSSTYLGWLQSRSDNDTPDEMTAYLIGSCVRLARSYLRSTVQEKRKA